MFSCSSLTEERVEGVVTASDGLIRRHLTVWLDAMLKAEQLPACISNLHASLSDMKANALTHDCLGELEVGRGKVRIRISRVM
jgi:hypothetical protein